jgi:hypothetical protein
LEGRPPEATGRSACDAVGLSQFMMLANMGFQGDCRTTAMGIMPHRDIAKALELSFGLDIPFYPQLPNVNYYEDMYVQASQHFPGITVDAENEKIFFDTTKFDQELIDYSERMVDPGFFSLSEDYSVVYQQFLGRDLQRYASVRGQVIGPVSFGFKVVDENNKPIIYNEQARILMFDFFQKKINVQCQELREKNRNAFVWLDDPGLGWVFSGLSGYSDVQTMRDYRDFLNGLDYPGALHLCANVNLPYLLNLGVSLLSFDAYQLELMPKGYTQAVVDFISSGGIIAWGIVPTDSFTLETESPESLAKRLLTYWEVIDRNSDLSVKQIAEQALIAPARCCLKNIGQVGASGEKAPSSGRESGDTTIEERVVESAFSYLSLISNIIRAELDL